MVDMDLDKMANWACVKQREWLDRAYFGLT